MRGSCLYKSESMRGLGTCGTMAMQRTRTMRGDLLEETRGLGDTENRRAPSVFILAAPVLSCFGAQAWQRGFTFPAALCPVLEVWSKRVSTGMRGRSLPAWGQIGAIRGKIILSENYRE